MDQLTRTNAGRADTALLVIEDTVESKEPEAEVAGSDLTVPFVRDFAVVEDFLVLFGAFFSLASSAGLYLYSMKSGSLSQTKTS